MEIHDSQSTIQLWYNLFQSDGDAEGTPIEAIGSKESIFNAKDLKENIERTVNNYYNLASTKRITTYRPWLDDSNSNAT